MPRHGIVREEGGHIKSCQRGHRDNEDGAGGCNMIAIVDVCYPE